MSKKLTESEKAMEQRVNSGAIVRASALSDALNIHLTMQTKGLQYKEFPDKPLRLGDRSN